ncbi:MAG: YbhB/YbcL family Raf kinase inhibitor-like protein [Candidatus Nealsonbacteria bacterium]|nr:YbhB/YbcL family Raf kinase inhibitor-like protein [Candidatus Nealsonbacteria bacterium]
MKITSPAFEKNGEIPEKYTCDGEDVNPPLEISGTPETAKSLVLIVDDPDAPMGTWDHWLVWNINPGISKIEEDSLPKGAVQGTNDFGKNPYGGPCPPSGTHHYHFKIYALDKSLDLEASANKSNLEKEMDGHILDWAELVATYQRE